MRLALTIVLLVVFALGGLALAVACLNCWFESKRLVFLGLAAWHLLAASCAFEGELHNYFDERLGRDDS